MMNAMITSRGTIRSGHDVREDFSAKSTGSWDGTVRTGYYESKGGAVRAYESVLKSYALDFDPAELWDMSNDSGHITIDVCIVDDSFGDDAVYKDCVGCAVIMWHRMPSGRYEFTGYLT